MQALIAGVSSYVVLLILGVPFRVPLAVLVGVFDLIPLVGATLAAVLVGIVTVFVDFPTATIVWAVWAIVYQQSRPTSSSRGSSRARLMCSRSSCSWQGCSEARCSA